MATGLHGGARDFAPRLRYRGVQDNIHLGCRQGSVEGLEPRHIEAVSDCKVDRGLGVHVDQADNVDVLPWR